MTSLEQVALVRNLVARVEAGAALPAELESAIAEYLAIDDEPFTDEDERAVTQGREDLARGETISLDEMTRRLER
jgi:hypothetical protein